MNNIRIILTTMLLACSSVSFAELEVGGEIEDRLDNDNTLIERYHRLSPSQQKKIRNKYQQFQELTPAQRKQKLKARFKDLTPEQKERARQRYENRANKRN